MIVPVMLVMSLVTPANNARKVATVALVNAEADVPSHWREALLRVLSEDTERAWVPPPAISLDEARAVLDCARFDDACAGKVAAMTGAALGLVVNLASDGAGLTISVGEVTAEGQTQRPVETLELEGRGADALDLARQFVRVASRGPVAYVTIDADEVGAEVSLDNARIGVAPLRAALAPGAHALTVRKEGKAPVLKTFSVTAGENPPVVLTFNAAGPSVALATTVGAQARQAPTVHATTPEREEHPKTTDSTLGWSLVAGGSSAIALGLGAGIPWLAAMSSTVPCADPEGCLPNPVEVYGGALKYSDGERYTFKVVDFPLATSLSLVSVGVGTIVTGMGLYLALSGDEGDAPSASHP